MPGTPPAPPGGPADVRRPWLPPALRAHGLTTTDVADLTYVVVDEIVADAVTLALSSWPWADGAGRLRFAVDDGTRGVTVDRHTLDAALYRGWLRRGPRVGDVFAADVPRPAHDAQEPDEAPRWQRPIAELLTGPVYDLTLEARKVAKLAAWAVVSEVLPAEAAERNGLLQKRDDATRAAPRRESVRSGRP